MKVSFYWKQSKKTNDLYLMMKMKNVKDVVVAVVYILSHDMRYAADLCDETLIKNEYGWAKKETAIRNVEKRFGIYKGR